MIFIDSNIPMYLVGAAHPNKERLLDLLQNKIIHGPDKMVSNVEVIQEIMHRYCAIDKREYISIGLEALNTLAEKIYPITEADALGALPFITKYPKLSSRDALHASFMKNNKIESILSFDSGFDTIPSITRLY